MFLGCDREYDPLSAALKIEEIQVIMTVLFLRHREEVFPCSVALWVPIHVTS